MSAFGVDFGQKVDLTASIRNILRNYPEGTSILKELVQNADDAGAKTITFCLDKRTHPSSYLASQSLVEFQGPSLLVHNDAVFTETDFQSIQRIGDSLKKSNDTKSKIGRFGIGFNSVYHMTELPSFVSSTYLVMLDPQARYLPDVNPSNPGKMVNFLANKEVLSRYRDQFIPYQTYGVDWSEPYAGTLFRIPLRTPKQAEDSLLSKRVMSTYDVESLLRSLRIEASAMLLFLKSVERIDIQIWGQEEVRPVPLFSAAVSNTTASLRELRSYVGDAVRVSSAAASGNFISTAGMPAAASMREAIVDYSLVIRCSGSGGEKYEETWEVCNQLGGGGQCARIACDPVNAFLRLVPWGGVAARISSTASCSSTEYASGLAYCFLPLPVQTGLPVMVNGFFELSSNRRDVWQGGSDMEGDGRTRALWNESLMRDIVSPSYVRLLLRVRDVLGFSDAYQSLWPSASLSAPWKHVALATLSLSASERLLRRNSNVVINNLATQSAELARKKPRSSIFSSSKHRDPVILGTGGMIGEENSFWIETRHAVMLPDHKQGLSDDDMIALTNVLLAAGQPVVTCSPNLRESVIKSGACQLLATPRFIRDSLRCKCANNQTGKQAESYVPTPEACKLLLKYCLSDIDPTHPFHEMDFLPIIPLESGEVGVLRIFSGEVRKNALELTAMGFSLTQARFALSRTNNDVARACDLLMSFDSTDDIITDPSSTVYIVCDDDARIVFSAAASILVNTSIIGASEVEFLTNKEMEVMSNVLRFSPSVVPDILRRIMPLECFEGLPVQLLSLGDAAAGLVDFLKDFWSYVSLHPDIVTAVVEGAAIVPTRQGILLPLSRLSNMIVKQRSDIDLPELVVDALDALGGHIVDESMISSFSSVPSVLWEYVYSSSRSGVLCVLDSLQRQNVTALVDTQESGNSATIFESLSPDQRKSLFLFIARSEPVSALSGKEAQIVRSLPIYTLCHNSQYIDLSQLSSRRVQYVALKNMARLSPVLLPENFLHYDTSQELELLSLLGVEVINRSKYFATEFLPRVESLHRSEPIAVEHDIFEMVQEVVSLMEEDRGFCTLLKNAKYIPNGSIGNDASDANEMGTRTLHRPSDLFDPDDDELTALLDASFFPCPEFQREDVLAHLRIAGLQSSLDWTGVLACARSIESMPQHVDVADRCVNTEDVSLQLSERQKRGACFLQYLTKNISRLMGEEKKSENRRSSIFSLRGLFGSEKQTTDTSSVAANINQLIDIAWVPICQQPPHEFIPWCQILTSVDVAPPRLCRPSNDAWLCSASLCLTTHPIYSDSLVRALKWGDPLPISVIAEQLKELAVKYIQKVDCSDSSGSDVGKSEESLQNARETITALIPLLYQRLNSCAPDELNTVVSILSAHPWIWVGDTFVHPNRVAYSSALSLVPYLYVIPQDLAVYRKLLDLFNVKDTFYARDYVAVLRQMAVESGATEDVNSTVAALHDYEIDLAVSLVTMLSAEGGGDRSSYSFRPLDHTIYVPDHMGKFAVATTLVCDDVPWLNGAEYASARSGLRLCHSHISTKVAQRVGVKSMRLMLVDRSVESFFNDADAHIEAFGQAESLTGRLRTILDMYPDGNPILSELIQNADDAGASVVRIMVDENSYPTESLMDASVAPLQGPSLLVSNDSRFSESDFRSLARIGQGSKLEKLSATGRFGLGFNSVYHLTDTPSFVSGEYLVVFDPHTTFIPGTTAAQPGLRMKFCSNSLRNTFPDQFKPYEFFGCNFEDPYPGTLFRFPLRTPELARKSEISKRSYSVADANQLLDQLTAQLAHHLIFLRSVTSIEVYRLKEGSASPVLCQRALSSMSNITAYNDQSLLRYFEKKFSKEANLSGSSDVPPTRDAFYTLLSSTPDSKLPSITYRVHVSIDVLVNGHAFVKSDDVKQDDGFIHSSVEYFVASGLRGGGAKALACDPRTRHLKLVPMGAVAACVSDSFTPSTSLNFPFIDGLAFCFLPLPIRTNLPVHINAYFELSSNRRDIWRGDDTTGESKLRGHWNTRLMEDIIAPLYAMLLQKLAAEINGHIPSTSSPLIQNEFHSIDQSYSSILSLLPCPPPPSPWDAVSAAVLPLIRDAKLLWCNCNGGMYISVGSALLLRDHRNNDYQSPLNDGNWSYGADDVHMLEKLLIAENVSVAVVPPQVYRCVAGAITPSFVRAHMMTRPPMGHPALDDKSLSDHEREKNASFLLDYSMRDMPPTSYSALHGLSIVPMEKLGELGTVGNSTDFPLFIATDAERKLLKSVGQYIVASERVVGTHTYNVIRSSNFGEECNIRELTPLDTLKLLRQIVPSFWFSEDVTIVNRLVAHENSACNDGQQKELVSVEWLQALWGYIIERECLSLFEDIFPIVPVIQPPNKPEGSYLSKIYQSTPILHMALKDSICSDDSLVALYDLGLYIFDPMRNSAYSQEVTSILCDPSPRGLLSALCSVEKRIASVSEKWNVKTRDAVRILILDNILAKLESVSAAECRVLCALPVYERYLPEYISSATSYAPLLSDSDSTPALQIPPRSVNNESLLDNRFVRIRDHRDRSLYSMLGLVEPSGGSFYSNFVIPRIEAGMYSDELISSLSIELLRSLAMLEKDNPGVIHQLRTVPFIKSAGGTPCRPDSLFDPHAPYLSSLLPQSAFPDQALYQSDSALLAALRLLGLGTSLSSSGILRAAEAIHSEFETSKSGLELNEHNSDVRVKISDTIQRAVNLVRYLDMNIDELIVDFESGSEGEHESSELSAWCATLRDLSWMPVYVSPPSVARLNGCIPPWPQAIHSSEIAKPSQCCSQENIWMCSSSCRLSNVDVKSQRLRSVLGWDKAISGRSVTQQLLALLNMSVAASLESTSAIQRNYMDSLTKVCYTVVPRMYAALAVAMENESEVEVEIWCRSLRMKAAIWVGGEFVESNRVAFEPLSSINTEPFLYVVKGELLSYRLLLLKLGVKEAFGPSDLSALLRDLHSTYRNRPLPPEKLDMCLGIIKITARLMQGGRSGDRLISTSQYDNIDEREEVFETGCTNEAGDENAAVAISQQYDEAHRLKQVRYEMGEIFLPDRQSIMCSAKALSFDDAPWISTQLSNRGGGGVRFIHKFVDVEAALLLGAKSLREQLFSGNDMVCPSAVAVREVVGNDRLHDSLGDLVGLADYLGASAVHVIYDERTHPCESLIHPGLADAQGQAISIFMEGVVLGGEELTQILMSPAVLHKLPSTVTVARSNSDNTSLEDVDAKYSHVGKRLNSAFVVTDCLQVLSGKQFFVFDPCGQYLMGPCNEMDAKFDKLGTSDSGRLHSRAQQYSLVGKDNQSVLSQFPDQFSPLLSLSFNGIYSGSLQDSGSIPGTLIRMSLRRSPSPISSYILSQEEVKICLRDCVGRFEGSLLFGVSLLTCTIQHWLEDSSIYDNNSAFTPSDRFPCRESYALNLVNGSQVHYIRKKTISDRSWKKSGNILTSFFKQQSPLAESSYRAIVNHKHGLLGQIETPLFSDQFSVLEGCSGESISRAEVKQSEQSTHDHNVEWLVHCLQGLEKSRGLALRDPYRRLGLMPFVSIAAPISAPSYLQKNVRERNWGIFNRYVYCSGGQVGSDPTGLPFHIEGSFIMHMDRRGLSLPDSGAFPGTRNHESIACTQIMPLDQLNQWNLTLLTSCVECMFAPFLLEIRDDIIRLATKDPSRQRELKYFYCYWPYLTRLQPQLSFHICRTQLLNILATKELFLGRNGFECQQSLVFPTSPFPAVVNSYLQSFMAFADIPVQVTKDFMLAGVQVDALTPSKFRDILRSDARTHCSRLNGRFEVILPLLRYCVSDMDRNPSDGEFARRRMYREIAGVPLLIMADERTQRFPTSPRDQAIIAPHAMHEIAPLLRGLYVHPFVVEDIGILAGNSMFRDTLHIKDMSTQFIKVGLYSTLRVVVTDWLGQRNLLLPVTWHRCRAIDWSPVLSSCGNSTVDSACGRSGRGVDVCVTSSKPSDLLLYILWRDVLGICDRQQLFVLENLPLLPVLAGSKRLLICTTITPLLLCTRGTTREQEANRENLRREAGRLTSLIHRDGKAIFEKIQRYTTTDMLEELSICRSFTQRVPADQEFFPDNVGRGESPQTFSQEGVSLEQPPVGTQDTMGAVEETFDTFSSSILGEALKTLRMPVIDVGIFEELPAVIRTSGVHLNTRNHELCHVGHKILACLSYLHDQHITIHELMPLSQSTPSLSERDDLVDAGPLLDFDSLTVTQRKYILLEILNAHRQRALSEEEIANLKILPLFTSRDGASVAVANCNGVYWCDSETALASLSETSTMKRDGFSINTDDSLKGHSPVVLIADSDLLELYYIIGADELTPSAVVRRFTLPSLGHMYGVDRLRIMSSLAAQWDEYREDTELLQLLKNVAFVPSWRALPNNGSDNAFDEHIFVEEEIDTYQVYRRPDQLFSWTNSDLLMALAGPHQSEYFAPPSMRTAHWHVVMLDLGMSSELDKDALIRLATDIEKSANSLRVGQNESEFTMCGGPIERGKRLLRYLRNSNRATTLFDVNVARRLSKISFVPVSIPIGVEAGGHVVYKADVCRFEQTLSASKGFLGFTVLPILAEDLSPPQTFSSSLGITTVPSVEIVLRHLRNLTSYGDALDRWNTTQYPVRESFGRIFHYLFDNWKSVSPSVKEALKTANLVPVGQTLIKPGRLFFRLSEDLSPFMHEVPRYFGTQEQFLKMLGVRERPSPTDYCKFLYELESECRGNGLNPNELRAVIAIVQAIANEREAEDDASVNRQMQLMGLYLPDEDSVLRPAVSSLYNDDGWLRERLGKGGEVAGNLFILHPYISKPLATQLGISFLSSVVVETLVENWICQDGCEQCDDELQEIASAIRRKEFIEGLESICLRKGGTVNGVAAAQTCKSITWAPETTLGVERLICSVDIRCTKRLLTDINVCVSHGSVSSTIGVGSMESICYVDDKCIGGPVIWISSTMLSPPISMSVAVSIGLCRLIGLDPSLAASMSLLLSAPSSDMCVRILADLRISGDVATLREHNRGTPGIPVNSVDYDLIELKPYRSYRLGEIVAYDIKHEERPVSTSLTRVEAGISLCYGKVVAISEEGKAGLRRISIRTGSSVVPLLSSEVYSFRPARDKALQSTSAVTIRNTLHMKPDSRGKTHLELLRRDTTSEDRAALGECEEACVVANSYSPVSQSEVLGALSTLLQRAGVPISFEKQDLVKRIMELEASNRETQEELRSERSQLVEALSTVDSMKTAGMCQICLCNRVSHVMSPCGHTICGICLGKMQRNKCPFCRANINTRTKFYLSSECEGSSSDDVAIL